mgnify:CR=1 FL=1
MYHVRELFATSANRNGKNQIIMIFIFIFDLNIKCVPFIDNY